MGETYDMPGEKFPALRTSHSVRVILCFFSGIILCVLIHFPTSRSDKTRTLTFLFVCLFISIKPKNPYFASRFGLEVKHLGVY